MSVLHLPDVSEFQANVDWAKVARANGGAAIIRACYGDGHVDRAWYGGARRADAHANGIRALGIYLYLVAGQPVAPQVTLFARLVGKLAPGEFAVVDLEEGAGSQGPRALEALGLLDRECGYPGYAGSWLYSGASFAAAAGLEPIFESKRHTWLADYQPTEPTDWHLAHSLWQHADAQLWPGIGPCDCSIFHGDVAALEARIWRNPTGAPHPPAAVAAPRLIVHGTAKAPVLRPTRPAPTPVHPAPPVAHPAPVPPPPPVAPAPAPAASAPDPVVAAAPARPVAVTSRPVQVTARPKSILDRLLLFLLPLIPGVLTVVAAVFHTDFGAYAPAVGAGVTGLAAAVAAIAHVQQPKTLVADLTGIVSQPERRST